MDDVEEFEKLAGLFTDDTFEDLLNKALLVGGTRVCEEDLWISTPSSMIRRSLLDVVCKDKVLLDEFVGILSADMAAIVQRFVVLDMDHEGLQDDERVAIQELGVSYGNDMWLWARDAFAQEQEFAGSDLKGFQVDEISDAIIRLLASAWA